MKNKYLLLSFVLLCAIGIVSTTKVNSKISFTPAGYCGDPTTGTTCSSSGCHGGAVQSVTPQALTLKIGTDSTALMTLDNTFKYAPGQKYYMFFDITEQAYAYGFQMTALTSTNNFAGAWGVITAANTKLLAGNPSYIGHKNANPATHSWLFTWTAPAADSAVTFYYAFNPGDSTSYVTTVPGSNIYAGTTTVHAQGNAVQNIADNVTDLQVYPNPVNGAFSLSFDVFKGGNASAYIYTIDGKINRQLFYENVGAGNFNRNYNISTLPAGIYLVQLNINGATVTKKIVKE